MRRHPPEQVTACTPNMDDLMVEELVLCFGRKVEDAKVFSAALKGFSCLCSIAGMLEKRF
jgi:hypothetical protein